MYILPNKIEKLIEDIRNDYQNGSVVIAKNAIKVLIEAIKIYKTREQFHIVEEIANQIIATKPTMAAVTNLTEYAIDQMKTTYNPKKFPSLLDNILSDMDMSKLFTSIAASEIFYIDDKQTKSVITCSYSATCMSVIGEKRHIKSVYAIKSLWKGISFGELVVEECRKNNIEAVLIDENEIQDMIPEVDFAITGADSFFPGKSIINGIPSKLLAEKAYGKVPYYVVAESFKYGTSKIVEDGFELVPGELITDIFSDKHNYRKRYFK